MHEWIFEAIKETVPDDGPWVATQVAEKVYKKLEARSDAEALKRELSIRELSRLARHVEHAKRMDSAPFGGRKNHRDDGLEEEVRQRVSALDLSIHTGECYIPMRKARQADLFRDASIREKAGHTTLRIAAFERRLGKHIGPDKEVGEAMTDAEYIALAEEMLGDEAHKVLGDRDEASDDELEETA